MKQQQVPIRCSVCTSTAQHMLLAVMLLCDRSCPEQAAFLLLLTEACESHIMHMGCHLQASACLPVRQGPEPLPSAVHPGLDQVWLFSC